MATDGAVGEGPRLRVHGLGVRFGGLDALVGVDLRVADGVTGVVARGDAAAAEAAIRLLSDDAAWSAMHRAALARGPGPSWDDIAARFEALA